MTTETKNSIQNSVQKKVLDLWFFHHCFGYGLVSMGVGKSKIIADCLNEYVKRFGMPPNKMPIVILVNSKYLRDTELPAELKKWGCEVKVKIACYQTAHRWVEKDIGLLIADELDYALADQGKYSNVFKKNEFRHFLGMTGTLIPDKFAESLSIFKQGLFIKYSLKDAHRDGILNPVKIWIHEVPLTTEVYEHTPYGEVAKYKWIQKKIDGLKRDITQQYAIKQDYWENDLDTTPVELEIIKLKNQKKYWEFSPKNESSRMNMMKKAKSLKDYAVKLKENLLATDVNHKVIVFSQLTSIVDMITDYQYHGEKADISVIDKLNTGEIRELGVVKKVHRGVNFKGLNNALVHSYTSSLTDAMQAYIGRLVRLPVDQTAHIHFLVSYYTHYEEKIYCQNATWLSEIVHNVELSHIEKNIINLNLK